MKHTDTRRQSPCSLHNKRRTAPPRPHYLYQPVHAKATSMHKYRTAFRAALSKTHGRKGGVTAPPYPICFAYIYRRCFELLCSLFFSLGLEVCRNSALRQCHGHLKPVGRLCLFIRPGHICRKWCRSRPAPSFPRQRCCCTRLHSASTAAASIGARGRLGV